MHVIDTILHTYHDIGIVSTPPTIRDGEWEIFKRGLKVGVREILKIIWGLPIQVRVEFFVWELVVLKLLLLI